MHTSERELEEQFLLMEQGDDKSGDRRRLLIQQLGALLHPTTASLVARIIPDQSQPEVVRLEALKLIEYGRVTSPADHQRIVEALAAILVSGVDDLIRQYALMASAIYMDDQRVREAVVALFTDNAEDIETRSNAFVATCQMADKATARRIVTPFVDDPDFGAAAREFLNRWQ